MTTTLEAAKPAPPAKHRKRPVLKMVAVIAAVPLVLLATVLLYATTRPDTFRVQRSTTIKTTPEKVYAIITDLRRGIEWSPYEQRDPAMKRTISGPAQGVGATLEWDGNADVGAGRMEITSATPPSKVVLDLEFFRPFACRNVAEYTLEPAGDSTKVTWAMHGPNLYVGKLMGLFIDMDTMVGTDFETGLANLKSLAERQN